MKSQANLPRNSQKGNLSRDKQPFVRTADSFVGGPTVDSDDSVGGTQESGSQRVYELSRAKGFLDTDNLLSGPDQPLHD